MATPVDPTLQASEIALRMSAVDALHQPMIESISVLLTNGKEVDATEIGTCVRQKIEETEKALKRKDRVEWALRHFKKALIEEVLWKVQHRPHVFLKRFGSLPTAGQPELRRQLLELEEVRLDTFRCCLPPDDPRMLLEREPPCTGFEVIDEINERLGHFLQMDEDNRSDPDNGIGSLKFERQTFDEIISAFSSSAAAIRAREDKNGMESERR